MRLSWILGPAADKPCFAYGTADFVVGGKPVNITSLTFLVRMCGKELNFGQQVGHQAGLPGHPAVNGYMSLPFQLLACS